ncbi:hypothetical protein APR50_02260 [Variovorax paradoxus]|jgi:hypothetical protein|uniref:DUF3348 domain-containing protein n=1 Tax=Variovorax paradoxus TaxID=34073 RepID=UPI0006E5944C|nr:hypothetical protein APR52_07615 [Variovorax paradoxus]KPV11972.1 hypothetical protein APR50_02260 [Variovorax paradoxus]KPV13808.1 hypothetical protein APR49_01390 [Variovorax paradoxus]KPV25287.1 hypothetical protein APR51_01145 [Variovorax paradoxus]KPV35776.1 hypothetical protein APR48_03340 [Variovorax paradoxus]
MAHVPQRTGFNGSALVRLLSRLTDGDIRESEQASADRLSQWFGWTDAISLSAALNGTPASLPPAPRGSVRADESECARVRAALAQAIAEDSNFAPAKARAATADAETPPDFAPMRQRYLARQQAMETAIGPLRGRLRARLAAGSHDMARLAAVDVVMEQVLGARERSLLASVPAALEKRFARLRKARQDEETGAEDNAAGGHADWLAVFRKDIQDVLQAELDFRFQPVDGLLEALRAGHKG